MTNGPCFQPDEKRVQVIDGVDMERSVDFLIIGAMKSGTSSLRAALRQHPDVQMPKSEVHFFSKQENFERGIDWYLSHFDSLDPTKMLGEKTANYAASRKAAERISEYNPGIKLLYILRNPIKRAISHYQHAQRKQKGGAVSVQDEISARRWQGENDYPHSYIHRSQYAKQLDVWLELFSHQQLKVLIFEEIVLDPSHWMEDVQKFLEIDVQTIEWPHNNPTKEQIRSKYPVDHDTIRRLQEVLMPTIEAMETHLGRRLPTWRDLPD